jgi:hypothetical protein
MLPSLPHVRFRACHKVGTFEHGRIKKQQHLWLTIQSKPYPYESLLRFREIESSVEERKESKMG